MTAPYEHMLEDYLPNIKTISDTLRTNIHKMAPQAVEAINPEQKHITYSVTNAVDSELIVLSPKKDFVLLVFRWSKQLVDPENLLGGQGQQSRFITIRTIDEANRPALSKLFADAWNNAVARVSVE